MADLLFAKRGHAALVTPQLVLLVRSEDSCEGVTSFPGRRDPRFTDR